MEKWCGKVALITGAGSGMGEAISQSLVDCNVTVVGVDINNEALQRVAANLSKCKGKFITIQVDLTKDDEVHELFRKINEEHSGLDICINSAGFGIGNRLLDGTTAEWRAMQELNVIALCLCSKLAVESMEKKNVSLGHIINISSLAGHRLGTLEMNFYSGTKYATRALSEGLRRELRERNSKIRVTMISPGIVQTLFHNQMFGDEKASQTYGSIHCLQATDIAHAIISALSTSPHSEINDILIRPLEQKM